MKKPSLLLSFILLSISFVNAQIKLSKVFSPDNSLISKEVIQNRQINRYYDGGAFRCGSSSSTNECDYEKMRQIIWQCWSEKTLCYLTYSGQTTDAFYIEHIFIEPNKNNQWLVIRRAENKHAIQEYRKPMRNLPKIYFLQWRKADDENVLAFKNKFGKIFDTF